MTRRHNSALETLPRNLYSHNTRVMSKRRTKEGPVELDGVIALRLSDRDIVNRFNVAMRATGATRSTLMLMSLQHGLGGAVRELVKQREQGLNEFYNWGQNPSPSPNSRRAHKFQPPSGTDPQI